MNWPADRLTKKEYRELVRLMKKSCDRDWKNETPEQVLIIFANGYYWRKRGSHEA